MPSTYPDMYVIVVDRCGRRLRLPTWAHSEEDAVAFATASLLKAGETIVEVLQVTDIDGASARTPGVDWSVKDPRTPYLSPNPSPEGEGELHEV